MNILEYLMIQKQLKYLVSKEEYETKLLHSLLDHLLA